MRALRFPGSRKRERSLALGFGLEIHGWHVKVDVIDLSRRPVWEMRCEITRSREMGPEEQRGHRFYIDDDAAERLEFDDWPDEQRRDRMCRAVKRFLLQDMDEAFAGPEGGLDSRRPLDEADLVAP